MYSHGLGGAAGAAGAVGGRKRARSGDHKIGEDERQQHQGQNDDDESRGSRLRVPETTDPGKSLPAAAARNPGGHCRRGVFDERARAGVDVVTEADAVVLIAAVAQGTRGNSWEHPAGLVTIAPRSAPKTIPDARPRSNAVGSGVASLPQPREVVPCPGPSLGCRGS